MRAYDDEVTRLQIRVPGFRHAAGQYVFVNVPAVSRWQWHPFSISSAPNDPDLPKGGPPLIESGARCVLLAHRVLVSMPAASGSAKGQHVARHAFPNPCPNLPLPHISLVSWNVLYPPMVSWSRFYCVLFLCLSAHRG